MGHEILTAGFVFEWELQLIKRRPVKKNIRSGAASLIVSHQKLRRAALAGLEQLCLAFEQDSKSVQGPVKKIFGGAAS
jgi:hypothetical protein